MDLLFVHVRKNAGTSIQQYFDDIFYWLETSYDPELLESPIPSDWVTFGVARNPYDRCISSWKYCHSTRDRPLLDCLANPPQPWEQIPDMQHLNRGHDYRHFTRTQCSFLFNKARTKSVDHILRFETLQEDIEALCEKYDIETYGRKLPHLNAGISRPQHILSLQERDAIYNFYQEDFTLLGYDR
jgi:hypothetical protein